MRGAIETYTGRLVYFHRVTAADIAVEDIAHALSYIPRFGGHTTWPISVAEHAVRVYLITRELGTRDPRILLAALHHDSHEAYLGDVPTPLKGLLGEPYGALAKQFDEAIATAFGFAASDFYTWPVKEADRLALWTEANEVKRDGATKVFHGRTLPGPEGMRLARKFRPEAALPALWTEQAFLAAHATLSERVLDAVAS